MSESEKYADYRWIKVGRYVEGTFDGEEPIPEEHVTTRLSQKSAYADWLKSELVKLQKHHVKETTFLIDEVRKLAAKIDSLNSALRYYQQREEAVNQQMQRSYQHDYDYLPYHDEDDR